MIASGRIPNISNGKEQSFIYPLGVTPMCQTF